jgi:hypothetical protein
MNLDLCGERLVTTNVSHGAALENRLNLSDMKLECSLDSNV